MTLKSIFILNRITMKENEKMNVQAEGLIISKPTKEQLAYLEKIRAEREKQNSKPKKA